MILSGIDHHQTMHYNDINVVQKSSSNSNNNTLKNKPSCSSTILVIYWRVCIIARSIDRSTDRQYLSCLECLPNSFQKIGNLIGCFARNPHLEVPSHSLAVVGWCSTLASKYPAVCGGAHLALCLNLVRVSQASSLPQKNNIHRLNPKHLQTPSISLKLTSITSTTSDPTPPSPHRIVDFHPGTACRNYRIFQNQ